MSRFQKGQSGNPKGRPRKRRPDISAFDIVLDKRLTVTQAGVERELTVEEALELQTYQDAIKGKRMAIRQLLKMIAKREEALAAKYPRKNKPVEVKRSYTSDNANRALEILDIAFNDTLPGAPPETSVMRMRLWATQAGISRPGSKHLDKDDRQKIAFFTQNGNELRWPKGAGE